jgi:anti-anti-sigma factor
MRALGVEQDLWGLAQTDSLASDLLHVAITRGESVPTMVLAGEVDMSSVPILYEQLEEIAADVRRDLVVDLGLVTFLDATGLSFLVTAHQQLESRGDRLVVFAPTPQVRRLFDLTALSSYLVIMPEGQD